MKSLRKTKTNKKIHNNYRNCIWCQPATDVHRAYNVRGTPVNKKTGGLKCFIESLEADKRRQEGRI